MRRAFHEEGESFHAWLTSMADGEPEQQDMAIDPATMQVEMPDIPVAGSGELGPVEDEVGEEPTGQDEQQNDTE